MHANEVRVAPGPTGDPLATIAARDEYWLGLDFHFRGFATGQSVQVLTQSGSYRVALLNAEGSALLEIRNGDQTLSWPSSAPISRDSWYRLRVGYKKSDGRFFGRVMAWDDQLGWYDMQGGIEGSTCYWRSSTSELPEHGSLVLGWDGTRDANRFNGYMDNVGLFNYLPAAGDNQTMSATCLEGQP